MLWTKRQETTTGTDSHNQGCCYRCNHSRCNHWSPILPPKHNSACVCHCAPYLMPHALLHSVLTAWTRAWLRNSADQPVIQIRSLPAWTHDSWLISLRVQVIWTRARNHLAGLLHISLCTHWRTTTPSWVLDPTQLVLIPRSLFLVYAFTDMEGVKPATCKQV